MTDSFTDCITVAKAELKQARQLLHEEISSYPTPISGCDAQFNHLIGERKRVLSALDSLDALIFVPTPRTPSLGSGIESR